MGLGLMLAGLAITAPPAAPVTIYGVTMLEPLSVPMCEKVGAFYRAPATGACYMPDQYHPDKAADLKFPADAPPDMVQGTVGIDLAPGRVVRAISFATHGASDQDEVLAKLIAKFGPPTTQETATMRNSYGAALPAIHAAWALAGGVTVVFSGIGNRADYGTVHIRAPGDADRSAGSSTPM